MRVNNYLRGSADIWQAGGCCLLKCIQSENLARGGHGDQVALMAGFVYII
jgi:hypothetical protein